METFVLLTGHCGEQNISMLKTHYLNASIVCSINNEAKVI